MWQTPSAQPWLHFTPAAFELKVVEYLHSLDHRLKRLQVSRPTPGPGPDGALEGLDGPQRLGRGAADQRIFQIFDLLAEVIQNGEITVYDCVEEGMGKVVRPGLSQAALFVAEPLPDGVEQAALLLLKGDQPIAAEDDADLLGDKFTAGVFMEEPEDDVEIIAVILALGALFRVQDVFEGQRVHAG